MEELVITGEPSALNTTVYGFVPPDIVRPHGSQVVNKSVTFGLMDGILDGDGEVGRQLVEDPAGNDGDV